MKFTCIAALVACTQATKTAELEDFLNEKISQIDDSFSSAEYLASDASTKKDALWTQVIADKSSGSFP